MGIRFNVNSATNEFLSIFEQELKWSLDAWEGEVLSKLKFGFFAKGADVSSEIRRESKMIVAFLKANTYVLADSYGTGSLMLEDNPAFQAYKNTWHKDRKGKYITGRKEGEYIDLFNRPRKSSGKLRGKVLEGLTLNNGYEINPVSPSYAIQDAEKALYSTYLPRVYKNTMNKMNFSKFLIES